MADSYYSATENSTGAQQEAGPDVTVNANPPPPPPPVNPRNVIVSNPGANAAANVPGRIGNGMSLLRGFNMSSVEALQAQYRALGSPRFIFSGGKYHQHPLFRFLTQITGVRKAHPELLFINGLPIKESYRKMSPERLEQEKKILALLPRETNDPAWKTQYDTVAARILGGQNRMADPATAAIPATPPIPSSETGIATEGAIPATPAAPATGDTSNTTSQFGKDVKSGYSPYGETEGIPTADTTGAPPIEAYTGLKNKPPSISQMGSGYRKGQGMLGGNFYGGSDNFTWSEGGG